MVFAFPYIHKRFTFNCQFTAENLLRLIITNTPRLTAFKSVLTIPLHVQEMVSSKFNGIHFYKASFVKYPTDIKTHINFVIKFIEVVVTLACKLLFTQNKYVKPYP